jgi:hypothetical protein
MSTALKGRNRPAAVMKGDHETRREVTLGVTRILGQRFLIRDNFRGHRWVYRGTRQIPPACSARHMDGVQKFWIVFAKQGFKCANFKAFLNTTHLRIDPLRPS